MSDAGAYPKWLKPALEYGPVLAFFVAYLMVKDRQYLIGGREYEGFILVTAGFVPLIALSTFFLWRLTGEVSKMQLVTLVLVVVFGGLTVWLNDDKFIKMKPTMVYLLLGALLGVGLLRGQSYLRVVMGERKLDDKTADGQPENFLHIATRNPRVVLAELQRRGVKHLLIEGGPTIISAFLDADAVDEIFWYQAPKILGTGKSAIPDLGIETLAQVRRWELDDLGMTPALTRLGDDLRVHLAPGAH